MDFKPKEQQQQQQQQQREHTMNWTYIIWTVAAVVVISMHYANYIGIEKSHAMGERQWWWRRRRLFPSTDWNIFFLTFLKLKFIQTQKKN